MTKTDPFETATLSALNGPEYGEMPAEIPSVRDEGREDLKI